MTAMLEAMQSEISFTPDVERAVVAVLRMFAARGRAVRLERSGGAGKLAGEAASPDGDGSGERVNLSVSPAGTGASAA